MSLYSIVAVAYPFVGEIIDAIPKWFSIPGYC